MTGTREYGILKEETISHNERNQEKSDESENKERDCQHCAASDEIIIFFHLAKL